MRSRKVIVAFCLISVTRQVLFLLLMGLVIRQEVDGRWLSNDVQVTAQKPANFPDQDLWTTLCVMVFIETEEWQLVIRKARKCLEKQKSVSLNSAQSLKPS